MYTNSNADGIGFVFSKRDKYVGVDIDGCVTYASDDKECLNPILSAFAKDVIEMMDSYTEMAELLGAQSIASFADAARISSSVISP